MAVPPRFSAPSRLAPWLASALLLAGIAAALLVADGRSLPAGEADRDEPLPGAEGPAPDFSLTLLDGRSFTLSEHLARDGRPVVLNFWASWCLPCREEMPTLDRAAGRHPGILFLGVAVEDDPTAAREFADEIAVRYPLAIDESGAMAARYPFFGLPTTWLIDADGMIVRRISGLVTEDLLEELLRADLGA